MFGVVVDRADNDALGPGSDMRQGSPLQLSVLIASFQVLHLAGVARINPLREGCKFAGVGDRGNSGEVKSSVTGRPLHSRFYFVEGSSQPSPQEERRAEEKIFLDSQLLDFFVVVLAVKDVPLLRAFQNGPLLGVDLLPCGEIDPRFLIHQVLKNLSSFLAD